MKRKTLSFINRCLAAVMALLGFQACDFPKKYGVPAPEYGTPYADFLVQGKVTDTKQEPLKDMQVVMKLYGSRPIDTVYTDENGQYQWKDAGPTYISGMNVVVNDTTGKFASDSAKVEFEYDRTQADGWKRGVATAEADFELKEKE